MSALFSESAAARQAAVKYRVLMAAIWCWPVCVVGVFTSLAFIAGFVPPPSPSLGAQEVADLFAANRTGIRIGVIGALWFTALMLPFYAAVSEEMRRIEGSFPILARIQWGGTVVLVTFFQIIGLVWLLASYRPEINPEIIRALNDFCWFVWSMLIPTFTLQYICIAIAGFMDIRPHPTWPRWAAYMNIWVAVTGAGGVLAVFFKDGPFAWNGIVGYWIPLVLFGVGNSVNAVLLYRRFQIDRAQPEAMSRIPAAPSRT